MDKGRLRGIGQNLYDIVKATVGPRSSCSNVTVEMERDQLIWSSQGHLDHGTESVPMASEVKLVLNNLLTHLDNLRTFGISSSTNL